MPLPRPVAADRDVVFETWHPQGWVVVVVLAALTGIVIGGTLSTFVLNRSATSPYEYHLWRWEADNLLSNVFARLDISHNPGAAEGNEAIQQYFRLTSEIQAAAAADPPDEAQVTALQKQRAKYENDVERYVEGLIAEAVRGAGLTHALPLFDAERIVWPPPDFELTTPPQLLVRSSRDVIKREGDTLLENDLTQADIDKIESATTNQDTVTLVVPIGGLAAYPAIVNADRPFDSFLDTASHEWVHHYLAFYPLGQQWTKGGDAYTLNETVANIAGEHIANLIRKNHTFTFADGLDGSGPPIDCPVAQRIDYNAEMRSLRMDVDALLAAGKVSEAEQEMDAKRDYFAQHCINIRKINQAYFAFYGTYADTSASSDPIGPKIEKVWDLTQDVGVFLRLMREVRNVSDLDLLVSTLQARVPQGG
jgi:hypothetical protein